MTLSIHPKGYSLSAWEIVSFPLRSCYSDRHYDLAVPQNHFRELHLWLGRIERVPLIGACVSVLEVAIVKICAAVQSFFSPSVSPVSPPKPKLSANLVLFTELADRVDREYHFTKDDLFALDMTPESRAKQPNSQHPAETVRWLRHETKYRTYGLRHVTGKELATKEAGQGFEMGCSLALCPRYAHTYEKGYLQAPNPSDSVNGGDSFFVLTEDVSPEAASKFQAGIDHFITNDCLSMDFRSLHIKTLEETSVQDVVQLCQTACFSLIDYEPVGSTPCDFGWGKGLARHRKKDLGPHQISPLTIFPDTLEESAKLLGVHHRLNDKFSSTEEENALYRLIAAHCRKALLQKIRSLDAKPLADSAVDSKVAVNH